MVTRLVDLSMYIVRLTAARWLIRSINALGYSITHATLTDAEAIPDAFKFLNRITFI